MQQDVQIWQYDKHWIHRFPAVTPLGPASAARTLARKKPGSWFIECRDSTKRLLQSVCVNPDQGPGGPAGLWRKESDPGESRWQTVFAEAGATPPRLRGYDPKGSILFTLGNQEQLVLQGDGKTIADMIEEAMWVIDILDPTDWDDGDEEADFEVEKVRRRSRPKAERYARYLDEQSLLLAYFQEMGQLLVRAVRHRDGAALEKLAGEIADKCASSPAAGASFPGAGLASNLDESVVGKLTQLEQSIKTGAGDYQMGVEALGSVAEAIWVLKRSASHYRKRKQTHSALDQKERKRDSHALAGDAPVTMCKVAGSISTILARAGIEVGGTVAGGAGAAFSFVSLVRQGRKSHHAQKRIDLLRGLRATTRRWIRHPGEGPPPSPRLVGLIDFAMSKSIRKQRIHRATTASATAGTAGGIIVIVTAVGVANVWNPLGWVIGGVGGLVGLGISGYKARHHFMSRAKKDEIAQEREWPNSTAEFVARLLAAARGKPGWNDSDEAIATDTLCLFGVQPDDWEDPSADGAITQRVRSKLNG